MSSFDAPHALYLFSLKNGKKKLAYGPSPAEALAILRRRLSAAEYAEIDEGRVERIRQQDLQRYVDQLG